MPRRRSRVAHDALAVETSRPRPGTVPYRQAVPDGPYEALAARLGDGRVIVVTQPTGRPVPDLVAYAPEVPASREQPGLPLRRP